MVGHLLSLGCGGAGRIGIGASAVAGDHLDGRTLLQPAGDGVRLAAGQQLDRTASLEIHNDRAIAMPAGECPVVDADDHGRGRRRHTAGASQPAQDRVAADGHPEPYG